MTSFPNLFPKKTYSALLSVINKLLDYREATIQLWANATEGGKSSEEKRTIHASLNLPNTIHCVCQSLQLPRLRNRSGTCESNPLLTREDRHW